MPTEVHQAAPDCPAAGATCSCCPWPARPQAPRQPPPQSTKVCPNLFLREISSNLHGVIRSGLRLQIVCDASFGPSVCCFAVAMPLADIFTKKDVMFKILALDASAWVVLHRELRQDAELKKIALQARVARAALRAARPPQNSDNSTVYLWYSDPRRTYSWSDARADAEAASAVAAVDRLFTQSRVRRR